MLVVETIAKIRRAYFAQKVTIKAICRDLHLSRKVVRKVIRSEATGFHYEREVQPRPKIGPWRDQLDTLLLENDGKPARERLTLIRVYEELRALGYAGGYDAVRRYARSWSKERAGATATAYVPLSFAPRQSANTTAGSCKCARIILSSLSPARRPRAGRRARSRTRSASLGLEPQSRRKEALAQRRVERMASG